MRAVPTWVDKVHDRDRNEQVIYSVPAEGLYLGMWEGGMISPPVEIGLTDT